MIVKRLRERLNNRLRSSKNNQPVVIDRLRFAETSNAENDCLDLPLVMSNGESTAASGDDHDSRPGVYLYSKSKSQRVSKNIDNILMDFNINIDPIIALISVLSIPIFSVVCVPLFFCVPFLVLLLIPVFFLVPFVLLLALPVLVSHR